MRAGTEGLTKTEQDHRDRRKIEIRKSIEDDEREDVRREGEHHRPAPAEHIGDETGGDLSQVVGHITDGIQQPDLEEGQAVIAEDQQDERFEESQVLEESVKRKTIELHIFFDQFTLPDLCMRKMLIGIT